MSTRYPRPGEIWEYTPAQECWFIIEKGRGPRRRLIMRADGEHRGEYEFTTYRLNNMWRKRA